MECDYLYGWIKKKKPHMQKSHQQMVNPRETAGSIDEEEEEEEDHGQVITQKKKKKKKIMVKS